MGEYGFRSAICSYLISKGVIVRRIDHCRAEDDYILDAAGNDLGMDHTVAFEDPLCWCLPEWQGACLITAYRFPWTRMDEGDRT